MDKSSVSPPTSEETSSTETMMVPVFSQVFSIFTQTGLMDSAKEITLWKHPVTSGAIFGILFILTLVGRYTPALVLLSSLFGTLAIICLFSLVAHHLSASLPVPELLEEPSRKLKEFFNDDNIAATSREVRGAFELSVKHTLLYVREVLFARNIPMSVPLIVGAFIVHKIFLRFHVSTLLLLVLLLSFSAPAAYFANRPLLDSVFTKGSTQIQGVCTQAKNGLIQMFHTPRKTPKPSKKAQKSD
eukprot:TRINITY_DN82231_c0_g1_i1.p1 TRINITY_DN82231_c0_g1~~TRINITY_DN82231_c0_g1_i1.p1  ORF type:complete len:244 (+),score=42.53 TRINITY_DN82231_c0_g1_i1:134-865(+)